MASGSAGLRVHLNKLNWQRNQPPDHCTVSRWYAEVCQRGLCTSGLAGCCTNESNQSPTVKAGDACWHICMLIPKRRGKREHANGRVKVQGKRTVTLHYVQTITPSCVRQDDQEPTEPYTISKFKCVHHSDRIQDSQTSVNTDTFFMFCDGGL